LSLYYSPDVQELYKLNPAITGRFGVAARAVVSEPVGDFPHVWKEVPQSSLLTVRGGDIEVHPFKPEG